MRTQAAVLRGTEERRPYSETRPLDVVQVQLSDPGPTEVLLQIEAAGVCHSDLSVVNGTRPRPTPMVLGHEAAGRVLAIGSSVIDLAVGQRVVCVFVPRCGICETCAVGRPGLCPSAKTANTLGELAGGGSRLRDLDGSPLHHHLGISGFAQHAIVDRRSLVPVPDDVPAVTAALFGCAALTGAGAVFNTARVSPGESLGIFGLGGVGMAALLAAVASGAWPIVVIDPVAEKQALALALGASYAFSPNESLKQINDISPGGLAHTIEAVGSEVALKAAWDATRPGGNTIAVGLPHPNRKIKIPAAQIVAEGRRLSGSYLGDSVPERDIPRMIQLWKAGRFPVDQLWSSSLPLGQINDAMETLASGEAMRQMVVF